VNSITYFFGRNKSNIEVVTFFEKNNKTMGMPLFVAFIYLIKLFLSIDSVRFA